MSLKPLFASNTAIESLKTIKVNLDNVSTAVWGCHSSDSDERIRMLTKAVAIDDKATRDEFVSLINAVVFLRKLRTDTHEALKGIAGQVDLLIKAESERSGMGVPKS